MLGLAAAFTLMTGCSDKQDDAADNSADASSADASSADASSDSPADAPSGDLPKITLSELKAFPTAHGYGRYATGGRGGQVIKVTNLNASGPGSFREAYGQTSGPRTIVFEVSGNINYGTVLSAKNDNVTIAGQTAPGDGIAIYSDAGGISHEASHSIIRHIRFRGSADKRSSLRLLASGKNLTDVIVDHCSFSWADATEMNIAATGNGSNEAYNVTVQYSINTNNTRGFLMYKNTYQFSVLRNYFGQLQQRAIRANYPDDFAENIHWFEQINNVLHGIGTFPINPSLGGKFAAVGNIYSESDMISVSSSSVVRGEPDGTGTPAKTHAYLSGNINETTPGDIESNLTPYLKPTPYESTDYVGKYILDAGTLESVLLGYVGARWYGSRDSQDVAVLTNYANRTGSLSYTGTLPTLSSAPYPTDSDGDGMSDEFEDAHGLDKNNDADRNATKTAWLFANEYTVINDAGYTNLEIYLAYLARDFEMLLTDLE